MKPSLLLIAILHLNVNCVNQESCITKLMDLEETIQEGADGKTYSLDRGWIQVPEIRSLPTSSCIQIPFIRLRTEAGNPLAPIFILDGGPGDDPSTIQNIKQMIPILSMLTVRSDIIIIEQRGNGLSRPNLSCQGTYNLPFDQPLNYNISAEIWQSYLNQCREQLNQQHVNLAGYNVLEMTEDIEAVRIALGYDKIKLFGGSFGSHHGLAYIRKYEKQVDQAVLLMMEGFDHTVKRPALVEDKLQRLADMVTNDANFRTLIPDLMHLVKSVLMKLEQQPQKIRTVHPRSGDSVDITVGKYDLQVITSHILGRFDYRELPFRFLQMSEGNYEWLASQAIQYRVGQSTNLMSVAVDLSSGASRERLNQVEAEAEQCILGNGINYITFTPQIGIRFSEVGNILRKSFRSSVPVLFISGSQDVRTPPENVQEVIPYFENGQHLVVQNASHDLFREAFQPLFPVLLDFLSEDPDFNVSQVEVKASGELKTK